MTDSTDAATAVRSPAVSRAMRILTALAGAGGGSMRLTALAKHIGAPKSTTFNLCETLVAEGVVRRTESGYALGWKVLELANSYLAGLDEIGEFYRVCSEVAPDFEETVHLGMLSDRVEITYVARREGRVPVPMVSRLGQPLPATCTATGKAALAALPDEVIKRRLDGYELPVMTPRSISNQDDLMKELSIIRERGYATDNGEMTQGLCCVGIALPYRPGAPQWAVGVTLLDVPDVHDRMERLLVVLRAVAERLGRNLVAPPPQQTGIEREMTS